MPLIVRGTIVVLFGLTVALFPSKASDINTAVRSRVLRFLGAMARQRYPDIMYVIWGIVAVAFGLFFVVVGVGWLTGVLVVVS